MVAMETETSLKECVCVCIDRVCCSYRAARVTYMFVVVTRVYFQYFRAVLFGQWGFAKRNHQGLTILLHGTPGTGKTLVAEAIGYEVGKPLKVVNCGELLSKWVGESTKNIDAIFQEARHQDAILVFDEAEGLFGERTGNKYVS